MRKLTFILICIISAVIYSRQQLGLPLPAWANNYVNDLFCIPIVLGIITQLVRWIKKDQTFKFSLLFMIGLATYYSVYFEYYLPKVNSRYTADWADVLLYFLGGSGYYLFNPSRPPVRSSPDS